MKTQEDNSHNSTNFCATDHHLAEGNCHCHKPNRGNQAFSESSTMHTSMKNLYLHMATMQCIECSAADVMNYIQCYSIANSILNEK